MQYGIRLSEMYGEKDMPYPEFCRLLTGITYKTPLGEIVQIRAEENRDVMKNWPNEYHRIRNEWRSNHSLMAQMTDEEKAAAAQRAQMIFAEMFGSVKSKS